MINVLFLKYKHKKFYYFLNSHVVAYDTFKKYDTFIEHLTLELFDL